MIGTLLVFALGFMAASLLALLFVPFLWQKAQSLARRRFEAEIPATVREMRGEVDGVRARAAFDLRREEMRATEALARATRERAEAGRVVLENGSLLARQSAMEADLAERGHRFEALEAVLSETRAERDDVRRDRERLHEAFEKRGSELEALHARHAVAQERLAALQDRAAHLERRVGEAERPRDAAPAAPRQDENRPVATRDEPAATIVAAPEAAPPEPTPFSPPTGGERLRAAIAAGVGARAPASRSRNAEIRESISDLAARVIRRQIDAEGPTSPIAAILARDTQSPSDDAPPTLAARVRALASETEGDATGVTPADPAPGTQPARKDGGGRSRRRSRR